MTDRTTKLLLGLIVLALWGLLLRPALTPLPAKAAPDAPAGATNGMVVTDRGVYLYSSDGSLYLFDQSLNLRARAIHDLNVAEGHYTFHTLRP